VKLTL
ncbi:lipoprotein Blc, partial [Vibrio cholerae O1 str. NHCC-010F]